jgi:hypothetical protein
MTGSPALRRPRASHDCVSRQGGLRASCDCVSRARSASGTERGSRGWGWGDDVEAEVAGGSEVAGGAERVLGGMTTQRQSYGAGGACAVERERKAEATRFQELYYWDS